MRRASPRPMAGKRLALEGLTVGAARRARRFASEKTPRRAAGALYSARSSWASPPAPASAHLRSNPPSWWPAPPPRVVASRRRDGEIFLNPREDGMKPGDTIGSYQVLAKLGEGGMGEVYKARDTRLDRDVAIKVLPELVAHDADRLSRFEREAKAVAALSHPNILAVHDTGTDGGRAYVVMELLDGETLRERLAAGPLPLRKAVDAAVQMARGLAAAHEKGLVHRDLKPDNVFLTHDGQVKILDFGLAKAAARMGSGVTETAVALTNPGSVMGTVGYMAPEQVRGTPVDARADLFALGAVLYEMLTGRRAFQRDTAAETMTAVLREDPPEWSGTQAAVSPALDRIVRHCLEKDPGERFQAARDVAFALEALVGAGPSASGGASPPALAAAAGRRRRGRVVIASVAVAALMLLAFWAGQRWPSRQRPAAARRSRASPSIDSRSPMRGSCPTAGRWSSASACRTAPHPSTRFAPARPLRSQSDSRARTCSRFRRTGNCWS